MPINSQKDSLMSKPIFKASGLLDAKATFLLNSKILNLSLNSI